MLERLPVRRDPRVLVLRDAGRYVQYGALDAWAVRGLGLHPGYPRAQLRLALVRTILTTRPTVVLVHVRHASLAALIRELTEKERLPTLFLDDREVAALRKKAPSFAELARAYHELRGLDAPDGAEALLLAASALSRLTLPSRHYASSRQPSHSTPALVRERPRSARPARLSDRPPARRRDPRRACER